MSKHEMAKKYAKDCIRLKRNYFPAHYELGVAEKGLGNKLAAISAFKMAKKLFDNGLIDCFIVGEFQNKIITSREALNLLGQ